MWLLRKFWFQLILAIMLGWITGTVWSYYRYTHTTSPTGELPTESHDHGDCGASSSQQECGS